MVRELSAVCPAYKYRFRKRRNLNFLRARPTLVYSSRKTGKWKNKKKKNEYESIFLVSDVRALLYTMSKRVCIIYIIIHLCSSSVRNERVCYEKPLYISITLSRAHVTFRWLTRSDPTAFTAHSAPSTPTAVYVMTGHSFREIVKRRSARISRLMRPFPVMGSVGHKMDFRPTTSIHEFSIPYLSLIPQKQSKLIILCVIARHCPRYCYY